MVIIRNPANAAVALAAVLGLEIAEMLVTQSLITRGLRESTHAKVNYICIQLYIIYLSEGHTVIDTTSRFLSVLTLVDPHI